MVRRQIITAVLDGWRADKLASGLLYWQPGKHTGSSSGISRVCCELTRIRNSPARYSVNLHMTTRNTLGYADGDLRDILLSLKDEGLTENSMIVIFGDHGFRLAGIRKNTARKIRRTLASHGHFPTKLVSKETPGTFLKVFKTIQTF